MFSADPDGPISMHAESDHGIRSMDSQDSWPLTAAPSSDSDSELTVLASGGDRPSLRGSVLGLVSLRVGLGVIWALNLLFVLDPANQFFSGFPATAISFSASAIGGSTLPAVASQYAPIFAPLIAGLTGYLALALLLGFTTRLACVIGFAFNAMLLLTQLGAVWVIPGGTDVGPQPLYLLLYFGLLIGGAGRSFSIDAIIRRTYRPKLFALLPSPVH
jgi:uncharacterized membrane protein YphA (DoxX/SURF4 family)